MPTTDQTATPPTTASDDAPRAPVYGEAGMYGRGTYTAPLSPSGFPPFMRPSDLAARLGLKAKTLAEYRVTGEGPEYIKAGPRLCLYTAAAVEQWLEKGRRTSTSAAA